MVSLSQSRLLANYRWIMVVVLLVAISMRVIGINNLSPPGLEHDEVAHWLINQEILEGRHGIYFAEAYGHEPAYHYFQTIFMILLGDNAFALRLPSAIIGLLLVAVSFALARRLFGLQSAILAAALLAVLFWPVFYSRLGLRAISLPLLSGISAYCWWKGLNSVPHATSKADQPSARTMGTQLPLRSSAKWFGLAGLIAGFSFYTYMASRVVPAIYLAFTVYLFIFHRKQIFNERKYGILLFFIVYLVVVAPLGIYLLTNPGVEVRIGEVDQPLKMMLAGDFQPILANIWRIIRMFGLQGDPLWRQNVALMPVFEPLVAIFFYVGLLISLWRWYKPRYSFIILWLFLSTFPSLVTIDAPSSIRMINALPILTTFPVIGLEVIHFFSRLSTDSIRLSPNNARFVAFVCLIALSALYIGRTGVAIFHTWPGNQEVKFVWQETLTNVASFLDNQNDSSPVAIGGWSPETMDEPTLDLSLERNDLNLRFFYPLRSVIIASSEGHLFSRLIVPENLALAPSLEKIVGSIASEKQVINSFLYYLLPENTIIEPQTPVGVQFGQEILFVGYDLYPNRDNDQVSEEIKTLNETLTLVTYWQVIQTTDDPRRIFVHGIDGKTGQISTQADALDAPAAFWRVGDMILQMHELDITNSDSLESVRIGVYNPRTGERLITPNGEEFVSIVPIDEE